MFFFTAVKSQSIYFKNKYKKWNQCASLGENDHLLASDEGQGLNCE